MTDHQLSLRRSYLRYLRIAFSSACGVVCILLVVLWVRSYWWHMSGQTGFASPTNFIVMSYRGEVVVKYVNHSNDIWTWTTTPAKNAGIYNNVPLYKSWEVLNAIGIGISHVQDGIIVALNYWLAILITTGCIFISYLKPRFSLRALLIASTLVAVLLGAVVLSSR